MNYILILILLTLVASQLTCDIYKEELLCIKNTNLTCRWNELTNQCLYTEGTNLGCSNTLSYQSCLAQTYYPDGTLAQCIFSGYCRKVLTAIDNCTPNLSRAACLAVESQYCFWEGQCISKTHDEALKVAQDQTLMQNASVGICRLITLFAAIHQQGVHSALTTLYRASLLTGNAATYHTQMIIPGCLEPKQEVYDYLTCDAAGLNYLGCIKISSQSCVFVTKCQQVADVTQLKCSDYLNNLACLSVSTFGETCIWLNGSCQYTQSGSLCSFDTQVSPSVCASVVYEECFYDSTTKKCNSMCKSWGNMKTEQACKQSPYNCIWSADTCVFDSTSQCGKLGQNKLSCMNADEKCRFTSGSCSTITSLDSFSCTSGLNQQACLHLNNPSQVCQFSTSCMALQITPETMCADLISVNPNACKKVTTDACYWTNGNCAVTDGSMDCTTKGMNRLGCLNSTMSSCKWDEASGSCVSKVVSRTDDCNSLKLVNAIACRMTQFRVNGVSQLCKYDSNSNNCISFTMDNTINCQTVGLNQTGCSSVIDSTQSCRWLSNQCVLVSTLGGAVTCSALQSVTSLTCALVQQVVQKCKYDGNRQSCTTSIPPTSACTDSGLNPYACASLNTNCYFDGNSNSCKVVTDYSLLTCDTNYPSKGACTSITKQGQYCLWNSIDLICQQQTFPVSLPCATYKSVNKWFCLAYQVSISKWVQAENFCTYDSTNKQCIAYSSASDWTDCGTSLDVNMHACVAYSNKAMQCYFDTATLKCTEAVNMPSNLTCQQCGKSMCSAITTQGQYCTWSSDPKNLKCAPTGQGGMCDSYLATNVNANLCASTGNNSACRFDSVTKFCVVVHVTNLTCDTAGLNEKACISNTNQACYFDKQNFKCSQVIGQTAQQVNCNDSTNQAGCLASLKQACFWDTNQCKEVTNKDFETATCASLTDALYNAIVCASVTTSGEMCAYDSASSHCYSLNMAITDCKSGYNVNTCESNEDCDTFDDKRLICSSKPTQGPNDCQNKTPVNNCLAVTTAPCAWINNSCIGISITPKSTCNQVSQTSVGKFNQVVCQRINASGEYCGYDTVNQVCMTITTSNNLCTTPGLNKQACIEKTKGSYCGFNQNQCSTIDDVSHLTCSSSLNEDACVVVTQQACQFNQGTKTCSEISDSDLYVSTCSTYSNKNTYTVSTIVCKYASSSSSCLYDTTDHVCKASTAPISQCTTNSTINKGYCLNYIQDQTCTFDDNYDCVAVTNFSYKCTNAISFKQCINSRQEACQWNGSACSSANINVSCSTLSNVNAIACMQNVNGTEKCSFQDNGLTSSCVVPAATVSCDGLNKVACLANTASPCYFDTMCIDISLTPYLAQCNNQFSFTQNACARIQTPGQLCKWDANSCVTIAISYSDVCATYGSAVYSPQVCASITTAACYWNNGCAAGIAASCDVIGANRLACVGATSGSCIFTNNLCLNVTTADVTQSVCTDPTNQNGCLNLYNGQACQWSGGQCTSISVTSGCTTYSQVNPGVCAMTTDSACIWSANACILVTASSTTCKRGMNQLACVQYTTAYCYFTSGMCLTVSNIEDLDCSSNLNQATCLSHTSKCCIWQSNACYSASSGSSCASLTSNSKFCCINLVGDHCSYSTTCTQLTVLNSRCNEAVNKTACFWIQQPCRWDSVMMQCQPAPNTFGCNASLNTAACITQSQDFCMFNASTSLCQDASLASCSSLLYSSQNMDNCALVTDVGCKQSIYGCEPTLISTQCQTKMNKIGCLDNTIACSWDADQSACKMANTQNNPPSCPGAGAGSVSRGYCSGFFSCRVNSNYECISASTSSDSCDDFNSVNSNNAALCTQFTTSPCQFNSTSLRCTSTIVGSVCKDNVNQLGCMYLLNNCYWNNGACDTLPNGTTFHKCSEISSKYTCLHYIATACQWNTLTNTCTNYSGKTTTCAEHLDPITSPGVCYYYSSDFCAYNGTTCYLESAQSVCTLSLSPLGCQANLSGNCYWNMSTGQCLQLSDSTLAAQMSCPMFRYSNKSFCLSPVNEGQTCHWTTNLCLSADVSQVTCLSDLALNGCRAVAKQFEQCIFTTKCQYTTNTNTSCDDKLNIYGCVAVLKDDQYCKWLGQQCSTLTDDGFLLDTHIIINQHVCRKAYTVSGAESSLPHISVKYDSINFVCMLADNDSDTCDTPGLNYYGCLMTKADSCDWSGIKCISYAGTTYTTCEGYASVSPKVCSSIIELKCYHDPSTLSCKTFVEIEDVFVNGISTLQGLNRLACLSITRQPTIWKDSKCQYNIILPAITICGELIDVNAASCAQIDVADVVCKYDNNGLCTTRFDGSFDTCSTAGLNKLGCVQIENAKCQFSEGSCSFYNGDVSICGNLIGVNAPVCAALNTQACKFSYLNRGCVDVQTQDTCDVEGINSIGCSLLNDCTYISNQCMCTGLTFVYSLIDCTKYQKEYCIQSQCTFDDKCRNKTCEDIPESSCNSTVIGRQTCYLNKHYCSSAYKCTDLFNISNCSLYKLNGVQCDIDHWNANHCVDQVCGHLSQEKCSGECTWSSYECVTKQCQYMKKEQCSGIMNNLECYWNGQQCVGLASCQEYASQFDVDSVSAQCTGKKILNKQCKWELTKPYGSDYHCTSSLCAQFGSSVQSCHGTEAEEQVCVLLQDYSCVACTEITDPCICMSMNGYCYYGESSGCRSNPCFNLNQETCIINSDRCVFNTTCQQTCSKLQYADCTLRSTDCHWDVHSYICVNGVEPSTSINTLADIIEVTNTWQYLMALQIFALLQLF